MVQSDGGDIELLTQAESEMTRQGWNPNGIFRETVRDSVLSISQDRLAKKSSSTGLDPVEAPVHRSPEGPAPGVT